MWYDTHDLHEQGRLRLPRASGWDEAREKAEAAEEMRRLQEDYIPPRPTSAFGVIAQVAKTVVETVTVDKKWGPQTNAPGLEKEGLVGSLVEVLFNRTMGAFECIEDWRRGLVTKYCATLAESKAKEAAAGSGGRGGRGGREGKDAVADSETKGDGDGSGEEEDGGGDGSRPPTAGSIAMSAASNGNGTGNGSRPTTASSQQSGQSADLRGVAAMVDSPFAGKHYIEFWDGWSTGWFDLTHPWAAKVCYFGCFIKVFVGCFLGVKKYIV